MSVFIVDVESDGPAPGLFSMVSFGAIRVDSKLDVCFKGMVKPISDSWVPEALAISSISREEHLLYPEPSIVMPQFKTWIEENSKGRPVFMSDNLAFDWQFVNYYMHAFSGGNPFGFSGRRIGDLYSGAVKDFFAASKWKSLRKTKHTHDPVDDARGNAEALLEISKRFGIKIPS